MPYVTTDVEVWVDLEEFDTEDLVEELEKRGKVVAGEDGTQFDERLVRIWELRRLGRPFDAELDKYLYEVLGRVV
jgi:hypothetical protein